MPSPDARPGGHGHAQGQGRASASASALAEGPSASFGLMPRSGAPLLALLLAAVLGLRLLLTLHNGAALHVDEAQYWDWSRALQWGYYSKPPLIAALIHTGTALAGHTLLGVRLLPMLCWLGASALLFWLCRAQLRDDRASGERLGWWAALLLLGTPASGLLGLVATTDAPLLLCWCACLLACAQALHSGARRWWLAAGLALGVGLLAKYTMAAAALSWAWLLADALWRQRRKTARAPAAARPGAARSAADGVGDSPAAILRGGLLAGAVALLCLLPNLLWNAQHGWPTLQHTADITTAAQRTRGMGGLAALGEFLGGQLLMLGPVLLCVAALAWRRRRQARQATATATAMTTACAPGSTAAASTAAAAGASPAGGGGVAGDLGKGDAHPDVSALHGPGATAAARRRLCTLGLAFSVPLLALGTLQAARAYAQINWAAPSLVGLCLLVALLAQPVLTRAALRRATVLSLLLCTLIVGLPRLWQTDPPLPDAPPKADIWARMRGWQPVLQRLQPDLQQYATVPLVASNREWLTQYAWARRTSGEQALAWPAQGRAPRHHYELQRALTPWPPAVLWLSSHPPGEAQLARYADWRLLALARAEGVTGQLWLGRGLRDTPAPSAP